MAKHRPQFSLGATLPSPCQDDLLWELGGKRSHLIVWMFGVLTGFAANRHLNLRQKAAPTGTKKAQKSGPVLPKGYFAPHSPHPLISPTHPTQSPHPLTPLTHPTYSPHPLTPPIHPTNREWGKVGWGEMARAGSWMVGVGCGVGW